MHVDVTAQAVEEEKVEWTLTHHPVRDIGVADSDVPRLSRIARRSHGSPTPVNYPLCTSARPPARNTTDPPSAGTHGHTLNARSGAPSAAGRTLRTLGGPLSDVHGEKAGLGLSGSAGPRRCASQRLRVGSRQSRRHQSPPTHGRTSSDERVLRPDQTVAAGPHPRRSWRWCLRSSRTRRSTATTRTDCRSGGRWCSGTWTCPTTPMSRVTRSA